MNRNFGPEKSLTRPLKKKSGRDSSGKVTVRHRGGGEKRHYRVIDFQQEKSGIFARVSSLEYDSNRTAKIALLVYQDGEKRYILAPEGLKVGDEVVSGEKAEIKIGNRTSLARIPLGVPVHNLELIPGKGGQIVRGAGSVATILAKASKVAEVRLPSGEIRKIPLACQASIGQVGYLEHKMEKLGKAGRARHLGRRPTVRGVAQHPGSHPHGGGEGRSGIGLPSPKSPWGKPTLGKKTRKKRKYSNGWIVKRRK